MTDIKKNLWESLRETKDFFPNPSKYDKVPVLDPNEYRLDDLGAIVKWSEYGNKTEFGWSIDHIYPISKGGDNNIKNLQILHWRNNELKADDFPTFGWDTSFKKESETISNISKLRPKLTFKASFVESLSDLYPNILQYKVSPLEAIMS